MIRRIVYGLMVLSLAACATTRKFEGRLDEWVGRDAKELVGQWGEPNRIHTYADGRKAYEYRFSDKHVHHASREHASESRLGAVGCVTYFFINSSTEAILSWKWEGHECTAK